jgi:hypothetical protein
MGPTEIAQRLTAEGIKVTPAQVSVEKGKWKKKLSGGTPTTIKRRGRKPRVVNSSNWEGKVGEFLTLAKVLGKERAQKALGLLD